MEKKPTPGARLAYCALLLAEGLLGILPMSLVWKLGSATGYLSYYCAKQRRDIVIHNLKLAHPEKPEKEVAALARDVFRRSFANMLSAFKTANMSGEEIKEHLTGKGMDIIANIPADQGTIFLLFHMGNWEILTRIREFMPNTNPMGSMYSPLKNPLIDKHMKKKREAGGFQLFSRKRGIIMANKFLRSGGFLGILCDQWAGLAGIRTELFGKQSSITALPAMLALKNECPLVPVSLQTSSPGHWEICFHQPIHLPPDHDKVSATRELVKTMEKIMRNYSDDIFWLHDRWKIIRQRKRSAQRRGKQTQ